MKAQRLLIAENNEEMCLALSRRLQVFHYVRCCGTGTEALQILREEKPDILVLNMLLPEIDGLTLLEQIASEHIRPMVLALTSYRSDYLTASAHRLGISCILSRPASLDIIVNRVLDMKDYLQALPPKRTPERILEELLGTLGIFPSCPGYRLLQEAIFLSAAATDRIQCKTILPDTAKLCNTTSSAVESSLRRTVETYWDPVTWSSFFPGQARRPTTKQFLQKLACVFRNAME